ncbi:hypothetical protein Hypma_006757 [Hypsizygus marmoreus]|uniref:Uncharacterized protein n=1 Tax=Hypsizygus marmoreus TaxID=39966 RepID=A0A369K012_HYPMA|nr:hypothetical protein Hypma_006757 [Hypsizygus marmoreus]
MPTATTTLKKTISTQISLKGTAPASPSTTNATLRSLYNRAARAFLLRDIPLTYSLIESAFAVIHPPGIVPDALADHRRKWDILRITLESTVYASPPSPHDALPEPLRENQTKSPQALLHGMHSRSLALFSPTKNSLNASLACFPTQVLITLVYSSLRLDCPDVGRVIIEDWLSRRDKYTSPDSVGDAKGGGYEKVLELYCLQVLPKLEQWDYAQEFLEYEGELPATVRESFKKSLKSLQAEVMSSRQPNHSLPLSPSSLQSSLRSYSPAPSTSSSSSSLSTTSTNTIVPSTVRGLPRSHPTLTPLTPANASTTSLSSDSTATPRPSSGHPVLRSRTTESSSTSFSSTVSNFTRSHPQAAALRPTNLSTYALIKASLAPYLTTSKVSTFVLLFVVIPVISLMVRARHRRQKALSLPGGNASSAELARRQLQAGVGDAGLFGRAWGEMVRVVSDTVRMAGSGLV